MDVVLERDNIIFQPIGFGEKGKVDAALDSIMSLTAKGLSSGNLHGRFAAPIFHRKLSQLSNDAGALTRGKMHPIFT